MNPFRSLFLSLFRTPPVIIHAMSFEGRIKEGMRAITFGVDTNSGVAGFIMPNSRVDIVAIVGAAESTKAAPVLSNVQVIAVGTTYQKAPGSGRRQRSVWPFTNQLDDRQQFARADLAAAA